VVMQAIKFESAPGYHLSVTLIKQLFAM
jgi:hypothetical protein